MLQKTGQRSLRPRMHKHLDFLVGKHLSQVFQKSNLKVHQCDPLSLALIQRGVSSWPAGRVCPDLHPGAEEGRPEGRLLPAADIGPPRVPTGALVYLHL